MRSNKKRIAVIKLDGSARRGRKWNEIKFTAKSDKAVLLATRVRMALFRSFTVHPLNVRDLDRGKVLQT